MIGQIDIEKTLELQPNKECLFVSVATILNHVVDVVNTIQKEREAERFEIQEWIDILEAVRKSVNTHEKQIDELQMKVEPEKCKALVDPYAEQRKWIGKLCRFWDLDDGSSYYGPLTKIHDDGNPYNYECNHKVCYANCEPVKDDIIYKGGDNE
jgi:hypothetical protein